MTDILKKALKKKDGKITSVGLWTFSKVHRKGRKGRPPKTGELIEIKSKNATKYKAGKALKDAIWIDFNKEDEIIA